jgi:hypothetical protein
MDDDEIEAWMIGSRDGAELLKICVRTVREEARCRHPNPPPLQSFSPHPVLDAKREDRPRPRPLPVNDDRGLVWAALNS